MARGSRLPRQGVVVTGADHQEGRLTVSAVVVAGVCVSVLVAATAVTGSWGVRVVGMAATLVMTALTVHAIVSEVRILEQGGRASRRWVLGVLVLALVGVGAVAWWFVVSAGHMLVVPDMRIPSAGGVSQ